LACEFDDIVLDSLFILYFPGKNAQARIVTYMIYCVVKIAKGPFILTVRDEESIRAHKSTQFLIEIKRVPYRLRLLQPHVIAAHGHRFLPGLSNPIFSMTAKIEKG
jgi:hypothetical protein